MTKYNEYDIRNFGAVGDGKTDNTDAIQKALDDAAKTMSTVIIPAGEFICGELHMHPGTGIQGSPAWSFRKNGSSTLILNDDPTAKCLLDITGAIGCTVYGVCFSGRKIQHDMPIHGIMVDKNDYGKEEDTPRIDACRISGFSGDGIHLKRIWCFSVRHSQCIGNRGSGLWVKGWDGFILDNWFSGNGGAGYAAVEENASITMTGNRIEWNGTSGIIVMGGDHYNITGNYIDRSGTTGISIIQRDDIRPFVISITGNVIYRSGKYAGTAQDPHESAHIRLEGANGLTCVGNTMNVGADDGGKGEYTPNYAMILRSLATSIVKDNVMHDGALIDLIVDLGEHQSGSIIKDNIGTICKPCSSK